MVMSAPYSGRGASCAATAVEKKMQTICTTRLGVDMRVPFDGLGKLGIRYHAATVRARPHHPRQHFDRRAKPGLDAIRKLAAFTLLLLKHRCHPVERQGL